MPILRSLRYQAALPVCSLPPRRAFVGNPPVPPDQRDKVPSSPALAPLEFNQDFEPMGQRIVAGATFYIDSELFQKAGATIRIELSLRHPLPLPQEADEELE